MKVLLRIAFLALIPHAASAAAQAVPHAQIGGLSRDQPKGEFISGMTRISSDADQVAVLPRKPGIMPSDTMSPAPLRPFEVGNLRPPARIGTLPRTRWQHRPNNRIWTRAALSALKAHGSALVNMNPADIATWCPAYASNPPAERRAFWVGFLSALAKYESTYKAGAVGGGGKWYGLLQILPGTARGYQCHARTGAELKSGAANLSCAIRIMAVTVPRDGVIYGRGGRGVAADWGPMRSKAKRAEMAGWLRRQNYCKPVGQTRPRTRPLSATASD